MRKSDNSGAVQKLLLSRIDAATSLSIGKRTVDHLIAHRELDVVKIGKRTLVTVESINKLIKARHAQTHNHRQNGNGHVPDAEAGEL